MCVDRLGASWAYGLYEGEELDCGLYETVRRCIVSYKFGRSGGRPMSVPKRSMNGQSLVKPIEVSIG